MSSDIFTDLEAIRQFLSDDVVHQVPAQLRAEVRAAAKLLREIAREADALPALLLAESTAMLALCEREAADDPGLVARLEISRLRQQLEMPMGSLSDHIRLHEALRGNIELVLLTLIDSFTKTPAGSTEKSAIGHRIEAIYDLLAAQADARVHWQSVFPVLRQDGSSFRQGAHDGS